MIVVMIGVMIMMVKGCGSIRTPSFRAGRFQVRALAPSHLDLTLDTMEMMIMMMMMVVVVVVVVVEAEEEEEERILPCRRLRHGPNIRIRVIPTPI